MKPVRKIPLVLSLIVVAGMGLASKWYAGPARNWVRDSLAGVWYVVFWCLLVFLISKKQRPWGICLAVCLATCCLEFLQLWQPPFLQYLRGFFLGRTLLGTSFSWWDFPYYIAGGCIGWLWLKGLQKGRAGRAGRPG